MKPRTLNALFTVMFVFNIDGQKIHHVISGKILEFKKYSIMNPS